MTKAASIANSGGADKIEILSKDHSKYYVSFEEVEGTGWMLISMVAEKDVLSDLNTFILLSVVVALVLVMAIAFLLQMTITRYVSKPVSFFL